MATKTDKEEVLLEKITRPKQSVRWVIVSCAVVLVALVVVMAIPFGYTATEVRAEQVPTTITEMVDTPYTNYECNKVNIKSSIEFVDGSHECESSEQVCSGQEQYCCSYGTECASYEQYCKSYGTKNGACKTWNWLHTVCSEYYQIQGDCISWGSRCASNKQVCEQQCSRCAGYNTVCKKWEHYANYEIRNVDDTGGTFVVSINFLDSNKNTVGTDTESVWVAAGDAVTKRFSYYDTSTVSVGYFNYYMGSSPQKEQCGNVIRTKQVPTEKVVMVPTDKEYQVQKSATLYERWSGQVDYYYHQ